MVIVVIIGILVAVAVPVFSNVQQNARVNAHNANVRILQGAASQMLAENAPLGAEATWNTIYGNAPASPTAWGRYLAEWPKNPITTGPRAGAYSITISVAGAVNVAPSPIEQRQPLWGRVSNPPPNGKQGDSSSCFLQS